MSSLPFEQDAYRVAKAVRMMELLSDHGLPMSLIPWDQDTNAVAKSVAAARMLELLIDRGVASEAECEPTPEHVRSVQEMIDAQAACRRRALKLVDEQPDDES